MAGVSTARRADPAQRASIYVYRHRPALGSRCSTLAALPIKVCTIQRVGTPTPTCPFSATCQPCSRQPVPASAPSSRLMQTSTMTSTPASKPASPSLRRAVPKADQPIASGCHHRPVSKALQQRRDPSFAEPVYLRLVAGVQEWDCCQRGGPLWSASPCQRPLGESPSKYSLRPNRQQAAPPRALTATAPSGASIS